MKKAPSRHCVTKKVATVIKKASTVDEKCFNKRPTWKKLREGSRFHKSCNGKDELLRDVRRWRPAATLRAAGPRWPAGVHMLLHGLYFSSQALT